MNRIESAVYDIVKRNPRMKNLIRDIYQGLLLLIPVSSVKLLTR